MVNSDNRFNRFWRVDCGTKAMGPVHAPLFPEPKFEEWWIFLADGPSEVQLSGCNPSCKLWEMMEFEVRSNLHIIYVYYKQNYIMINIHIYIYIYVYYIYTYIYIIYLYYWIIYCRSFCALNMCKSQRWFFQTMTSHGWPEVEGAPNTRIIAFEHGALGALEVRRTTTPWPTYGRHKCYMDEYGLLIWIIWMMFINNPTLMIINMDDILIISWRNSLSHQVTAR